MVGAIIDTVVYLATTENASLGGLVGTVARGAVESAINPLAKLGKVSKLISAAGAIQAKISKGTRAAGKVRRDVSRAVARSRSAKDNVVYESRRSHQIEYVGITKDFKSRSGVHRRNGREIAPMARMQGLSRFDAHAVEQVMINRNRRTLSNKINSVSRRDAMYWAYVARGTWLLGRSGHGWR